MINSLDVALGFQQPTYPFKTNSNYVQTNAPTSSGPFLSNFSGFCGHKTLFLIFLKPINDFLSVVMLNSLDDALGFQPPTYPFETNSNYVQTNAPTSSRPFLSNSSGFCGQKTYFFICFKA